MLASTFRLLPFLLSALPLLASPALEGLVLPYRTVEVSAFVGSHLVEVKAGEGDLVKAGQPLAQLYVRLEELEMKRSKAVLDRREYEAKGARSLFDDRVIPESKARESSFELELARLHYETAVEQVRLRTILAPIDGLVIERTRDVGEAVGASQTVFRIMDLSRAFIVCTTKPEKALRLAVGQKVSVRVAHPEGSAPFPAEVVLVAPGTDPTGLFRVKLMVANPPQALRAGQKAIVEFPD